MSPEAVTAVLVSARRTGLPAQREDPGVRHADLAQQTWRRRLGTAPMPYLISLESEKVDDLTALAW